MLKPSVELTKDLEISTYSLVVGIAKKAREISANAEISGEVLVEKPVDMAVQQYINKDFEIIETEPCAECGRLDCICEYRPVIRQQEPVLEMLNEEAEAIEE